MKSLYAIVLCIYSLFAEIQPKPDRANQLKYLNAEYAAAMEVHRGMDLSEKAALDVAVSDTANLYLPKYLELAEDTPEDEVALQACRWIITHTSQKRLEQKVWLHADEKCWELITKHHYFHPEIGALVLNAGEHASPAREVFLEKLPNDWTHAVEVHGHALLSLAELKAQKYELLLDAKTTRTEELRISKEWATYIADNTLAQLAGEIDVLYRDVLAHYSHVSISSSAAATAQFANLGERARAGLEKFERKLLDAATAPLAETEVKQDAFSSSSNGG